MLDARAGNQPMHEDTLLGVARALLDAADPAILARAEPLLDDLVDSGAASGLLSVRVEALAMQAMLRERQGNPAGALTSVSEALRLAEPEGYVRKFVDLGPSLQRVLRLARARGVLPGSVALLLEAFGESPMAPSPGGELPEPLSARELDVVRLMATGLSNREIGDRLFVSPETVKKHTGNIYAKLGVRGRVEAVSRARSLALID
jgi:LuxR family maltose regulon positive regulatory protein